MNLLILRVKTIDLLISNLKKYIFINIKNRKKMWFFIIVNKNKY